MSETTCSHLVIRHVDFLFRVIADFDCVHFDEGPVFVGALEVLFALHRAVVLAHRLVVLKQKDCIRGG